MAARPLRICLASSELAPLAKTGGLADVAAALSVYFDSAGHDVRVLIPRYSRIDREDLEIRPVLSNLSLEFGGGSIDYSIDAVTLPGRDTTVHLLNCPQLFGRDAIYTDDADEYLRFIVLSRGTLEMCQHMGFAPDIVSCHDWQTAMIPLYLRTMYGWDQLFARTRSVLTIHNIGYQGMFPAHVLENLYLAGAEQHLHQDDLKAGVINFLKTGILYADLVTTVSPTYAREILGDDYGMGLNHVLRDRMHSVVGILNGVDYDEWDPATDTLIPANYSPDDMGGKVECKRALLEELDLEQDLDVPLVGIVTRLVGQKGIDLIEQVVPSLLEQRRFSLAVLGSGEPRYERFFEWLQGVFPGRVCFYRGYNNRLAHWIEAGSDMFLMPSLYEPSGLNQMYSLRYGTVPIVRETGGLADSIELADASTGLGTGVIFRDYNAGSLARAMRSALDLFANRDVWQKIVANGMAKDFSWDRQGAQYVDLFRQLSDSQ